MKSNKIVKIILMCFFSLSLAFPNITSWITTSSGVKNIHVINVGILSEHVVYGGGYKAYERALNYSWFVNGTQYKFNVNILGWYDVIKNLSNAEYDVIVAPYGAPLPLLVNSYLKPREANEWKNKIKSFIANGGGFIGHCGGTWLMCYLNSNFTTIDTILEKLINSPKVTLGLSNVTLHQDAAIPIFDQICGNKSMGEMAYEAYSGIAGYPGGFCLHMKVNKSHPIFRGYGKDTILIRYIGGPGLIPKKGVSILLTYPSKEEFDKYTIHEWEFGGRRNLTRNIIKQVIKEFFNFPKSNVRECFYGLLNISWQTPDWKKTNKIVKMHIANMAAMTAENYGKGKIILCGAHPELYVWNISKGILNETDTCCDNIWDGFVKWDGLTPDDLIPANDWIVRREVAWAAGLSEEELPPIG